HTTLCRATCGPWGPPGPRLWRSSASPTSHEEPEDVPGPLGRLPDPLGCLRGALPASRPVRVLPVPHRPARELGGERRAAQARPFASRPPEISYRAIAAATHALSDSVPPPIGIETTWSQISRVSRDRPLPSAPMTSATGSVPSSS